MNKERTCHEVPGLPHVLIDGFKLAPRKGVERCIYFLTHFHGDHYGGLNENWSGHPIYCTPVTAALVKQQLGVQPRWLNEIEIGASCNITGAKVTFLDANHCPGAALLLFECEDGKVHLHTGDMRYCPRMQTYPALLAVRGRIDRVYFDTTYGHPKHTFPPQAESIQAICDAVTAALRGNFVSHESGTEAEAAASTAAYLPEKEEAAVEARNGGSSSRSSGRKSSSAGSDEANGDDAEEAAEAAAAAACRSAESGPSVGERASDTLVLLSAYGIGKERIMLAVARATGLKIFVTPRKIRVLLCLRLSDEEMGFFTTDPHATPLHVCRMGFCGDMWPYFRPNWTNLARYREKLGLRYAHVVGVIPTGWAEASNWNKKMKCVTQKDATVQSFAYSEHSNFEELMEFAKFLRPREIVPTVFSGERDRDKILKRFFSCTDKTAATRAFLATMTRSAGGVAAQAGQEKQEQTYGTRSGRDGKSVGSSAGSASGSSGSSNGGSGGSGGSGGGSSAQQSERETEDAVPTSEAACVDLTESSAVASPERGASSGAADVAVVDVWACAACTFENAASSERCAMCSTVRGAQTPQVEALQQSKGGRSKALPENRGSQAPLKKRRRHVAAGRDDAGNKLITHFFGRPKVEN